MKIILLADVYKHGVAGEVVDVANGFARNFLIPKGLAVQATPGELKRAEKLRETAEARRMQYEGMLNELGHKIDGTELVFFRRAAHSGKLFGSVTTTEIADELMAETEVDINRRRISQQPLREIGLHEVPVRLGTDVSPVLNIRIVAEDQQIEYETQRAAVAEGKLEAVAYDEDGRVLPQKIKEKKVDEPAEEPDEYDAPPASELEDDIEAVADEVPEAVAEAVEETDGEAS